MRNRITVSAGADPQKNGASLLDAIEQGREEPSEIYLPGGRYAVSSIRLSSDMTLHLSADAHLEASEDWRDYTDYHVPTTIEYLHSERIVSLWNLPPHYFNAVITAIEAENVSVIGEPGSTINGSNCFDPAGEEKFRGPMGMVFCRCKNVTLQGYTFLDAANWAHQLDSCVNVSIRNVKVLAGHDGFNVHHCENVRIEHCHIQTGDDCIAGYDARNVTISACYMNTSCNGFRYGGENLLVENCTLEGPGLYPHRVSGRHNMLYAFEYYSLAEDTIRENSANWIIRNCTFRNMDGLIHYDFGDIKEHQTNKPLEQITLDGFEISGMKKASTFKGKAGCHSRLILKNGTIDMTGMESSVFFITDENASIETGNVAVYGGIIAI